MSIVCLKFNRIRLNKDKGLLSKNCMSRRRQRFKRLLFQNVLSNREVIYQINAEDFSEIASSS